MSGALWRIEAPKLLFLGKAFLPERLHSHHHGFRLRLGKLLDLREEVMEDPGTVLGLVFIVLAAIFIIGLFLVEKP